jgi:hypothetical protein
MSGVKHDPEALTDSMKLDQLLGLVATMNTWLEHQSKRLTMVEAAIPLLAQACGVVLPTGSGGTVGSTPSIGTDAGSGVGGDMDGAPAAGDVPDPGNELATVGGEPTRTDGSGGMGPSHGDSFTVCGGGGWVPAVDLLEVDSITNGGKIRAPVDRRLISLPLTGRLTH